MSCLVVVDIGIPHPVITQCTFKSLPVNEKSRDTAVDDLEQIRQEGMNLWSLAIGIESHIASEVAGNLHAIERQGITAGARPKALSEMQAILRNTSVALDWEDPIIVPAGDLMLVVQMALQRLG